MSPTTMIVIITINHYSQQHSVFPRPKTHADDYDSGSRSTYSHMLVYFDKLQPFGSVQSINKVFRLVQ